MLHSKLHSQKGFNLIRDDWGEDARANVHVLLEGAPWSDIEGATASFPASRGLSARWALKNGSNFKDRSRSGDVEGIRIGGQGKRVTLKGANM